MLENGEEVPLAGIDLDYKQIFYISFAQVDILMFQYYSYETACSILVFLV